MKPLIVCKVDAAGAQCTKEESGHYTEAVEAALAKVNGKATTWTIRSHIGLMTYADRAERMLGERGVTKKNRNGCAVVVRPAGPSARRYKHSVKSTLVTLTRNTGSWLLTDARTAEVFPGTSEHFLLNVNRDAAIDIAHQSFRGIVVQGGADVLRDVINYGAGCHVAYARIFTQDTYAAVEMDSRIVTERVFISRLGRGDNLHFALYSKDRKALEQAMIVARLSHAETLVFEGIREPE